MKNDVSNKSAEIKFKIRRFRLGRRDRKETWKRTAKNKKFANTAVKNSDPKLQVTLVVITAGTNKRRSETQGHGLIGARKQILIPC